MLLEVKFLEEGKNIIVSAGAGSGKTAVLSERVIRKLEKTDINKLLILTFTKEAANEMKERKVFNKLREENKNHKIEEVGREIRSTFCWGNDNNIIDRTKN